MVALPRTIFALLFAAATAAAAVAAKAAGNRPPEDERKFVSAAIEAVIVNVTAQLADPVVAEIFAGAFPNTLDTTVEFFGVDEDGFADGYIITGDINAMWLRDSTNQVAAYWPYTQEDPRLAQLMCGLVNRQIRYVLHDPYANAFNFADEGGPWENDYRKPPMTPELHEGKYELDSLAAVLKLFNNYLSHGLDFSCIDAKAQWAQGMQVVLNTIRTQQAATDEEWDNPAYTFARETSVATDTLMMRSRGPPAKRCGLSKCFFRPSDDATTLPFLIPANAMAVVELERFAAHLTNLGIQPGLASQAASLAAEIRAAIAEVGIIDHPKYGQIYAYEVDGYSSYYMMDDANVPSLLSFPYLGFTEKNDPIYQRTRAAILSEGNPFYFVGTAGKGIGGPHVGMGYIWPMGLSIQILTSDDDDEIVEALNTLKSSTAGTNLMHESFWKNDPNNYSTTSFFLTGSR